MSERDRNKDLKIQKIQGAVLKEVFVITEVNNKEGDLKNDKQVSDKKLRIDISSLIKTCTESLIFIGPSNIEGII